MLRPQFQQKLKLAFLMLASALLILAEPVSARKSNESSGRADRAASSARESTPQSAPARAAAPAPAPARAPAPAPVIRAPEPSRSIQQSRPVQQPSVSVQSRSITSSPSVSVQQPRSTQSRTITNNPAPSVQSRNVITNKQPVQTQVKSNNSVSINRNVTSRTITNESISRSNIISNRNTESINSSNRARQPAESLNNRISSELSSQIGNTIGTQPESTTNIRKQENSSSRSRVVLPFDRETGSTRTSPQTEVQQPAASSSNRRVIAETTQKTNRVTPPSISERQPAESSKSTSSIDRANTDIGIMIGPERTPPKEAGKPAASPNGRENRDRASIGSRIGEQEIPNTRIQRQSTIGDTEGTNSRIGGIITQRETAAAPGDETRISERTTGGRADRRTDRPQIEQDRTSTDLIDRTRITRINPDERTAVTNDIRTDERSGRRDLRGHRYEPVQPAQIIYRDRPPQRDSHPDLHLFVDRHDRLYQRTIAPNYWYRICYDRGPWLTFGYAYPYYQRKYVFVSLGGYWPLDYTYRRYYWYGYHPYYWYGYYPLARQVGTDVNYYYTYNYYYSDDSPAYDSGTILNSKYYDIVAREPAPQPAEATLADTYFEEAVDAFEAGKYDLAIEKFYRAMELAPNDMILPFAYSQALFAAGRYSEAAEVLRTALAKAKPDQEGVFYPRGLYPNDEALLAQLDELADEAENYSFDADLQLLLGYQLLGIGQHDKAVLPLKNASLDMKNKQAATVLMNLLTKIKLNEPKSEVPEEPKQEQPEIIIPEKIELNRIELNETNTENPDIQSIAFLGFGDTTTELKSENAAIESKAEPVIANNATIEKTAANEPTHQKAKEGIILAALFVLAGSTGIGHFMHH
ncbi:MAG: tetratricopeptide repeat protein [Sedimentisphaerales bacterium]|nr:tetratricopeptide repeat protein [Sedimentisphaerales bacterium]